MDTARLIVKYHGDMADTYDQLRVGTPQWNSEQTIVEELLGTYPAGTSVLDVPVGTGRFLTTYIKLGFSATGVDISSSMLEKARAKIPADRCKLALQEGRISALDFADETFDVVVCIRFMDWVSGAFFEKALAELVRVSRGPIIVSIPTYTPLSRIRPLSRSGFLRLLRQWKLRFYMFRVRSNGVIHKEKSLYDLFNRLNVDVARRLSIDLPTTQASMSGHERNIYLLQKRYRKSFDATHVRSIYYRE